MLKHSAGHRAKPNGFFWVFSLFDVPTCQLSAVSQENGGRNAVEIEDLSCASEHRLLFLYAHNDLQTFHCTSLVHESHLDAPHPSQAFRARHSRIKL
jgi:hypothetical protein